MIRLEKFCEHYNKIIVWGAGAFFENNYKRNFEVAYIVDSNAELYGKEMHGIEIKDPQKILDENVSEIAVLICSSFDMIEVMLSTMPRSSCPTMCSVIG